MTFRKIPIMFTFTATTNESPPPCQRLEKRRIFRTNEDLRLMQKTKESLVFYIMYSSQILFSCDLARWGRNF